MPVEQLTQSGPTHAHDYEACGDGRGKCTCLCLSCGAAHEELAKPVEQVTRLPPLPPHDDEACGSGLITECGCSCEGCSVVQALFDEFPSSSNDATHDVRWHQPAAFSTSRQMTADEAVALKQKILDTFGGPENAGETMELRSDLPYAGPAVTITIPLDVESPRAS